MLSGEPVDRVKQLTLRATKKKKNTSQKDAENPKKKKTGKKKGKKTSKKNGKVSSRRCLLKRASSQMARPEASVDEEAWPNDAWDDAVPEDEAEIKKPRKSGAAAPKAKAKGKAAAKAKAPGAKAKAKATAKAGAKAKAKATPKARAKAKAKATAKAGAKAKAKATAKAGAKAKAKATAKAGAKAKGRPRKTDPSPKAKADSIKKGKVPLASEAPEMEFDFHAEDAAEQVETLIAEFGFAYSGSDYADVPTFKHEMKEEMPKFVHTLFNPYWTRSACGLTLKALRRDLGSFNFGTNHMPPHLRMALAVKAAWILAPGVFNVVCFDRWLCIHMPHVWCVPVLINMFIGTQTVLSHAGVSTYRQSLEVETPVLFQGQPGGEEALRSSCQRWRRTRPKAGSPGHSG